jgi:GNAT superfamily N-acetyltransferase
MAVSSARRTWRASHPDDRTAKVAAPRWLGWSCSVRRASIEPYTAAQKDACLAIFDSNVPEYFASSERGELAEFLEAPRGEYFVMTLDGDVVGCGGAGLMEDDLVMTWGMIHAREHRTGLGGQLLAARATRGATRFPSARRVRLTTSRAARGFFERFGFVTSGATNGLITMVTAATVRPFTDADRARIPALTRMLHRAYAPLADRGMRYLASHQDDATTLARITYGVALLAMDRDVVVGTATYYRTKRASGCAWYDRPDVASFGQLAIDPAYQGRGIARMLMATVEQRAREDGAAELAIDTSERAVELIATYTGRGFRLVGHTQWPDTNYRSVILSKRLRRDRACG